jgi:outer membrane immunogenic protein
MKKFALALLTTTAAFTGSAFAADLPMKAPAAAPIAQPFSWTGCYIGAGFGYGVWNQDQTGFEGPPATATVQQRTFTQTNGGRGWFGTVGGGCDYQFGLGAGIPGINQIVIGALADYDFGSIKGKMQIPDILINSMVGQEKMSSSWDIGGRIGWLVTPMVLTYFSGGYTQARFDQVNMIGQFVGQTEQSIIPAHTYSGWFLGSGLEYTTNWLPGLFWKTEYRFSEFNHANLPQICTINCGTPGPNGVFLDSQKFVQTIRTELVYRFNWGGPVVAKY